MTHLFSELPKISGNVSPGQQWVWGPSTANRELEGTHVREEVKEIKSKNC